MRIYSFRTFYVVLFFILSFTVPTLALAGTSVGCNNSYVLMSDSELVIEVSPTNNNDTANIQCALDAATFFGVPVVRLGPFVYFITGISVTGFEGALEGRSISSTRIDVFNNGLNCEAMENAGFRSAAMMFSEGTPMVRFMTIRAQTPCTSGQRLGSVIHFTGESAYANNCSNDVIFGSVDRVVIDGIDESANTGPVAGVIVAPEGFFFNSCKDTLLGTFKLNRSTVTELTVGIYSSMRAGAQVDVNFNDFLYNEAAVYFSDSYQNATVTQNQFTGHSTGFRSYFGVNVASGINPGAPTKTSAVITNNRFNINASAMPAYAVSLGTFVNGIELSSVVINNVFSLSGTEGYGVFGGDVSNTHVSANSFFGGGEAAVYVTGNRQVSNWTISGNTGLSGYNSYGGYDFYLGNNTTRCIIGPSQGASYYSSGSGNYILATGAQTDNVESGIHQKNPEDATDREIRKAANAEHSDRLLELLVGG